MCLICIEFNKGKMSVEEGWKNLSEMESDMLKKHVEEVEEMLWDAWSALRTDAISDSSQEPRSEHRTTESDWYEDHGQGD